MGLSDNGEASHFYPTYGRLCRSLALKTHHALKDLTYISRTCLEARNSRDGSSPYFVVGKTYPKLVFSKEWKRLHGKLILKYLHPFPTCHQNSHQNPIHVPSISHPKPHLFASPPAPPPDALLGLPQGQGLEHRNPPGIAHRQLLDPNGLMVSTW